MYKKRFGDRFDGRRIRSLDPMFTIIPYIMDSKTASQNLFKFDIPLKNIETYMHKKRAEGIPLTMLDIIISTLVRTFSQKPAIHRFIVGKRIYAHNKIQVSMNVKKEMTEKAPETTIKLEFDPYSTIFEVHDKLQKEIAKNKAYDNDNGTDLLTKSITVLPSFIVNGFIKFVKWIDRMGMLPKALIELSPFHTSTYITDLGSLGIQPVFHHLYEFGTSSVFIALGAKFKQLELGANSEPVSEKYLTITVTIDERICDGFNFASALKLVKKLFKNPELLEIPPEKVYEDIE